MYRLTFSFPCNFTRLDKNVLVNLSCLPDPTRGLYIVDPAASETSRTGCGLVKPVRRETQGHSGSNDELPSNSVSFVVFNVRRKNKLFRL